MSCKNLCVQRNSMSCKNLICAKEQWYKTYLCKGTERQNLFVQMNSETSSAISCPWDVLHHWWAQVLGLHNTQLKAIAIEINHWSSGTVDLFNLQLLVADHPWEKRIMSRQTGCNGICCKSSSFILACRSSFTVTDWLVFSVIVSVCLKWDTSHKSNHNDLSLLSVVSALCLLACVSQMLICYYAFFGELVSLAGQSFNALDGRGVIVNNKLQHKSKWFKAENENIGWQRLV